MPFVLGVVQCCAVMLYKRFYLSNSVMEFHPKYIVPTVIYVAAKVEEQYINVDTIAEQLKVRFGHSRNVESDRSCWGWFRSTTHKSLGMR